MPVVQVPLQALVRLKPGERVALDGVVTDGQSSVNQAPVTGESIPVDKFAGDMVFAGTINQSGELTFRVTTAAGNTTLARIIHSVDQAQSKRAPTQKFVDRFAIIYTLAVFAIAIAVAVLTPWLMSLTVLEAVDKALVLLVIACPCALVISTPVTLVSALSAAARHFDQGRHLLGKRPFAQSRGPGQNRHADPRPARAGGLERVVGQPASASPAMGGQLGQPL